MSTSHRVVLVVPHLLSGPEAPSVLESNLPSLHKLAEGSRVVKLSALPDEPNTGHHKGVRSTLTPEAAWFGLDPSSIAIQDGPLIVSALGADPPERSVHFHLSLLSLKDGVVTRPDIAIPESQRAFLMSGMKKLNSKNLTVVEGPNYDHGLVWDDGSLDLGVSRPEALQGHTLDGFLPEGDGERILRRYIDDSVNLLSELRVNIEREEEGLPPLNLLWPWGPGFRYPLPNLALRLGAVGRVESDSMRLDGLTRLVGFKHGIRSDFGRGLKVRFHRLVDLARKHSRLLVVVDSFTELRLVGRFEEMEWLAAEMDRELLARLLDLAHGARLRVTVVAPGGYTGSNPDSASPTGLCLDYDSGDVSSNRVPFDERALEEKSLGTASPWSACGFRE